MAQKQINNINMNHPSTNNTGCTISGGFIVFGGWLTIKCESLGMQCYCKFGGLGVGAISANNDYLIYAADDVEHSWDRLVNDTVSVEVTSSEITFYDKHSNEVGVIHAFDPAKMENPAVWGAFIGGGTAKWSPM